MDEDGYEGKDEGPMGCTCGPLGWHGHYTDCPLYLPNQDDLVEVDG